MSEELEQLLKNLKLRRILEIFEEQLRAADKGDIMMPRPSARMMESNPHACGVDDTA